MKAKSNKTPTSKTPTGSTRVRTKLPAAKGSLESKAVVLKRKVVSKAPSVPQKPVLATKPVQLAKVPTPAMTLAKNLRATLSGTDSNRLGETTKPVLVPAAVVELIAFSIGDKIVYPGHGVGEVEDIKSTSVGGSEQQFYNIKILETGMKVFVPLAQASTVGLRRIVDKKAVDKVYEILKDRDFKIDTQTWNRRFREYSQKIKTGSVYEIAVVLRDLSVLSSGKELSFGEKKMLDVAQNLLVSELAIAKARPQDKIMVELKEIFA